MRKLLGTLLFFATGINAAQAAPGACATKAIAMLDALGHHDYAAASQHMGASLQAPQQQKMLISLWEALIKNNWGPYQPHGKAETIASDARATTIRLPLQFDHGSTTATITCNAKAGGAIDELVLL
jgi:hypothetical protein